LFYINERQDFAPATSDSNINLLVHHRTDDVIDNFPNSGDSLELPIDNNLKPVPIQVKSA